MPSDLVRAKLAAVEQSGNLAGDYAQLEPIVLRDLQNVKGMFKGVAFEDVMKDPVLYDQVVDAYYNRIEDFGIKDENEKVLWWLMPTRYKKMDGDIAKLPNARLKNIMENRVKNLGDFLAQMQRAKALSRSL